MNSRLSLVRSGQMPPSSVLSNTFALMPSRQAFSMMFLVSSTLVLLREGWSLEQAEIRVTFWKTHSWRARNSRRARAPKDAPTADSFPVVLSWTAFSIIVRQFLRENSSLMRAPCPGRSTRMHRYPLAVSSTACGLNMAFENPSLCTNSISLLLPSPSTSHHSRLSSAFSPPVLLMKQVLQTSDTVTSGRVVLEGSGKLAQLAQAVRPHWLQVMETRLKCLQSEYYTACAVE